MASDFLTRDARTGQLVLPVDVTPIRSHIPCESCSYRRSHYRATLQPPGRARVTLRLCDNCIEAIRR